VTTTGPWQPDILPGYSARELSLGVAPEDGEPPDELRAALIRRDGVPRSVAVLYVHGWNDYFFHTHVGDHFAALGTSFYALDLRRCGRSLRDRQYAGYVADLDDYAVELDLATSAILAEHDELIVMAHSTGGLTAALWADANPGRVAALILNSPWLDLQGSWVLRSLAAGLIGQLGTRHPTAVIPLPEQVRYAKSLHAKYGGEWNYDLRLKSEVPVPIRVGWVAAVLKGHERVAAGLDIDCPVLVLSSKRSDFKLRWDASLRRADTVLDVDQIAARAGRLGDVVTLVRIRDGVHDLTLSTEPVRRQLWAEIDRWLSAYAPIATVDPLTDPRTGQSPLRSPERTDDGHGEMSLSP
jgi:alpha-beta hydrolase superfamily lysophospholipase